MGKLPCGRGRIAEPCQANSVEVAHPAVVELTAWLAVVVLAVVVGAAIAGELFHVSGASALTALVSAGAAFTAITGLGIKMIEFLGP